ncbi:MAG: DUF1460 domain-containing protein [Symploca sp. SIO1C4]|uniref:DUF1460 domain-containing protein n=1 Tax=Symploca sp. SIO1C4 TaxID=2607765 RepID=A0A6B3NI62_9CYAN|nr:DUF1460 domain-containing protein [Symploca sp. SIO1C4]
MLKTLGITVVLPALTFSATWGFTPPSKVIPNLDTLSLISEQAGEKKQPRNIIFNPHHTLGFVSLKQEVSEAENKDNFQRLIEVAIARHLYQLSMGEIIQAIAEEFLGKAYKAGLLDKSTQETLTISLTEFDCVLFVETVLAIARNLALQDYSYQTFTNHIRNQRYLNGQLDGYCSRLHYFSVWIDDNQKRGTIKNIVPELGGIFLKKKLNFMSTHRHRYRRLRDNDANYRCIVEMEANLDPVSIDYIPHSQIRNTYSLLQPGDIIGIATNISGLDVTHTGLVYRFPDGNLGLIHASPIGEVTIARDLHRYVGNVNNAIGILVARPLDPRFLSPVNQ